MSDEQAVDFVDKRLKLSAHEKLALMDELNCTTDDPLLVIKVNSAWVDVHGEAVANAVLDSIACFEMEGGHRRDNIAGGHRWIFHFQTMDDMERCSASVHQEHPTAFSFSRKAMRQFAGQPLPGGTSHPSLGQSAVILKMGPRKSDGSNYQFFAL